MNKNDYAHILEENEPPKENNELCWGMTTNQFREFGITLVLNPRPSIVIDFGHRELRMGWLWG